MVAKVPLLGEDVAKTSLAVAWRQEQECFSCDMEGRVGLDGSGAGSDRRN